MIVRQPRQFLKENSDRTLCDEEHEITPEYPRLSRFLHDNHQYGCDNDSYYQQGL